MAASRSPRGWRPGLHWGARNTGQEEAALFPLSWSSGLRILSLAQHLGEAERETTSLATPLVQAPGVSAPPHGSQSHVTVASHTFAQETMALVSAGLCVLCVNTFKCSADPLGYGTGDTRGRRVGPTRVCRC